MVKDAPAARERPGGCGRLCRQMPALRDSRSAQTPVPVTWPEREHPWDRFSFTRGAGNGVWDREPGPPGLLARVCRRSFVLPLVRRFFLGTCVVASSAGWSSHR